MTTDILISEAPVRSRSLPVPPADVTRWMADEYSRPSQERMRGGHGESLPLPLPLPAVTGGSGEPPIPPPPRPTAVNPDPRHSGGLMVPAEYVLAEGGIANGKALTHHVIQRDAQAARAIGLLADSPPATLPAIIAIIERIQKENREIDATLSREPERPRPVPPAPIPAPRSTPHVPPRMVPARAPYMGTPPVMDRDSFAIVIAFAVLVAALLWGAAGMPH